MEDIKSLYLAAKSSGSTRDIAAYTEAVQEFLESNPNGYMSNLEYIISSSIGIKTWGPFVEKYGLSIACYDDVVNVFESCIEKAEAAQQDTSVYEEALEDLVDFRERYSNCFMMYDNLDLIEEKSHGNLKYDFRAATDLDTGHSLKIVYSLDDIDITATGRNYKDKDITDEEKEKENADVKKEIRSKGNLDHQSRGQKILAIVDLNTGKRLKKATIGGIFGIGDKVFHIKEGEIDPIKSFKSTYWSKNDKQYQDMSLMATRYSVGAKISNKEHLNTGRGVELQKIDIELIKEIEDDLEGLDKKLGNKKNFKKAIKFLDEIIDKKKIETLSRSDLTELNMMATDAINKAKSSDKKDLRELGEKLEKKWNKARKLFEKKSRKKHPKQYAESYYSFNDDGVQHRKLLSGMIEEFGEMAIPDLLITADEIGENAVCQILEYVMRNDEYNPLFTQFMLEAVTDMSSVGDFLTEMICEYVDSQEDLQVFEEKSHGKLKFDFRAALDLKTGHPLKIVYGLDNMRFSTKKKKGWGDGSYKDLIEDLDNDKDRENRVRKYGNTDHRTKGQQVLAIVDMMTKENLNEVQCVGIFNHEEIKHIIEKKFDGKKAKEYAKKKGLHIYKVKVGDVEDKYTFKSTYWNKALDGAFNNIATNDSMREIISMDVCNREHKVRQRGTGKDGDWIGHTPWTTSMHATSFKNHVENNEGKTPKDRDSFFYGIIGGRDFHGGGFRVFEFLDDKLKDVHNEEEYKKLIDTLEKDLEPEIYPSGSTNKSGFKRDKEIISKLKEMSFTDAKTMVYGMSKELRNEKKKLKKLKESVIIQDFFEYAYDYSYQSLVDNMMKRNLTIIQESALMGTTKDAFTYYTEDEIEALTEYITFKEYQLVCVDEDKAAEVYNEICSLYEQLDGIITESGDLLEEDVADGILPMLPNNGVPTQGLTEAPWVVNTMNKKTGDVPTYLGRNHNLGYGEDPGSDSGEDPDPESLKRPSAANDSDDVSDDLSTSEDDGDVEADDVKRQDQTPVNNYYYYTYNNSLNKNSHSFNKDSENTTTRTDRHDTHDSHDRYDKHDDHSTHSNTRRVVNDSSTKDDHSTNSSVRRSTDDHSTGKRINSDDYRVSVPKVESKMPWELDILPANDIFTEEVGDADDMKPESDHPIKDTLTDIDRKTTKLQQGAKKKVQDIQNVGRAVTKPIKRTNDWINKIVNDWKDKDETRIKERMADPHVRNNLFSAIKKAIEIGAFAKAGLLLNPIFFFLGGLRFIGKNKREYRIRNEMIGELKAELEVIDKKIEDADSDPDRERGKRAKYKLIRLRNEINKKLLRVGGSRGWKKII